MNSILKSNSNTNSSTTNTSEYVVLQGYHKKFKTMKKKYFVLHSDSPTNSARLEYYDSEKKYKTKSNPKRTIILKNCFNINRRLDTKHKCVIALSIKDGGFSIVLDSEDELTKWLRALLSLQRGEDLESDPPKPMFEHVWQVQVQRKGLAEEKGLLGSYHVCLTSKSLQLVRIGPRTNLGENRMYSVEFYLTTIRRCGDSQCFFFMEVGRHSAIGAGELWMETEDTLIAQNMHTMIINAMTSKTRDDTLGPMRKRSSSANESSKPISYLQRRQTHSGNKPVQSSPLTGSILGRERCDSLPTRNRTNSECSNQSGHNTSMPPPRSIPSLSNRPHSMYNNRHSHSPPINAISPSIGCSESEGSSLSIDETDSFGHSLTPDESGNFVSRYYNSRSTRGAIPEENSAEFWCADNEKPISVTETTSTLDKLNNHGILSLPLSSNQHTITGFRKDNLTLHSHPESAEIQAQYNMDIYSPPCGSSPCDHTGSGYIPVSPSVDCNRGVVYTGSSGGHSRASSLAEETPDGYVSMEPIQNHQQQSEDYVDMCQSIKQQTAPTTTHSGGFSSAASSSSITSGTPSSDLKFAEYPLEKVISTRFTPDDEDMQSIDERPARAYSVGSRLEHNKRKLRVELFSNNEQTNSRVRAFSVGSRAKVPRCDLSRGQFSSNLLFTNNSNNINNNNNNNVDTVLNINKGTKSSSAPILAHKSQSSVERMSDLMEIDYSKNSEQQQQHSDTTSLDKISTSPKKRITSFPVSVPLSGSNKKLEAIGFSKTTPGYMEMRPGSFPDNISSPLAFSKSGRENYGYLEMKATSLSKSPTSLSSSPFKYNNVLSPNKYTTKHAQYPTKEFHTEGADYINMSPSSEGQLPSSLTKEINTTNKSNMMDCDMPETASTPDGYMEMSWNRTKDQSSITNNQLESMDTSNWINRSTSMPIDIKSKEKLYNPKIIQSNNSTILKNNSMENDLSGNSNFHNAMFSFSPNSPPNKTSFIPNLVNERKCLVDATSGVVTIDTKVKTDSTTTDMTEMKRILKAESFKNNTSSGGIQLKACLEKLDALTNEYADMSLDTGAKKKTKHFNNINSLENIGESLEYVNFLPGTPLPNDSKPTPNIENIQVPTKKFPIVQKSSICNFEGFKPILSGNDEIFYKNDKKSKTLSKISPKSVSKKTHGYELLQMRSESSLQSKRSLSRPSSVNSEKISPLKGQVRPNSANSDCILPISASSSTSTLCGGNSSSSSSTLCGSKSQSPLAQSRPQSFTDTPFESIKKQESTGSITESNINFVTSRPPSVSSEKEIHYASLDLPQTTNPVTTSSNNEIAGGGAGLQSSVTKANSSTSGESSTSPSPNANFCQQQPTFTYAQIDFNKIESLKLSKGSSNAPI